METETLKRLFNFLKADPEDAFTLYSIAYEYAKEGNHPEALRYFNQMTQKHPDYIGTYYHLGKSLEAIGEGNKAEKTYKKGIVLARKASDFHSLSELQRALNRLLGLDYEDEV